MTNEILGPLFITLVLIVFPFYMLIWQKVWHSSKTQIQKGREIGSEVSQLKQEIIKEENIKRERRQILTMHAMQRLFPKMSKKEIMKEIELFEIETPHLNHLRTDDNYVKEALTHIFSKVNNSRS